MTTLPPALRSYFSGTAVLHHRRHNGTVMRPPDPATILAWPAGAPEAAVVMGARTRATYFAGTVTDQCLTMRFRPGAAAALLGRPISDLTDTALPVGRAFADLLATADPDRPHATVLDRAATLLRWSARSFMRSPRWP